MKYRIGATGFICFITCYHTEFLQFIFDKAMLFGSYIQSLLNNKITKKETVMNISTGLKVLTLAAFIAAGSGQIDARRHHHCSGCPARVIVRVPASRPVVTPRVSNRFSQSDRLAMAIAYLSSHEHLTAKQYAKITSLNKDAAEAELDVFALDRNIPISAVVKGKKKLYVKTS